MRSVHTIARIRPFLSEEDSSVSILSPTTHGEPAVILSGQGQLRGVSRHYSFSEVHGSDSPQSDIFSSSVQETLISSLTGSNTSIVAYGSTASGKTWTLFGKDHQSLNSLSYSIDQDSGLIPRSLSLLYRHLGSHQTISISFIQIYCYAGKEIITDLLCTSSDANPSHLKALELVWNSTKFEVDNCLQIDCKSFSDALFLTGVGCENRLVRDRQSFSPLDSDYIPSSRSHCLLTVHIKNANQSEVIGSVTFADLAGSERCSPETMDETRSINYSNLAFSKLIHSLSTGNTPCWRESALTKLLWPSIASSSLSPHPTNVLLITLSPGVNDWSSSLQSLVLASKAKKITLEHRQVIESGVERKFECSGCRLLDQENSGLKRQLNIIQNKLVSEGNVSKGPEPVNPKAAVRSLLEVNGILRFQLSVVENDRDSLLSQVKTLSSYVSDLENELAQVKNFQPPLMLDKVCETDELNTGTRTIDYRSTESQSRRMSQASINDVPSRPSSAKSMVNLSFSESRPSSRSSTRSFSRISSALDHFGTVQNRSMTNRRNSVKSRILRTAR
ncbi:hypothetical protein GEMRC1_006510 [Eukaryota sp. GEM-RC1]